MSHYRTGLRARLRLLIGQADFQCGRFDQWAEPWPYVDPPYITMAYLNAINQGNRALRSDNYPRMLQAYDELMGVVIPASEITLAIKRLRPEATP